MESLNDIKIRVQELTEKEKWAEAYKLCNQILELDPENSSFIKLKKHIEAEVERKNQQSIENELKNLEPLLKEEKYEDYLRQISPLQSYVDQFPIIGEKIIQAQKLMGKQYEDRRDQALEEINNEIRQKKENLNFEKIFQNLDQLEKINIDKAKLAEVRSKAANIWINKLIKENTGLINSEKFEDIIVFLLKIQKIDPQNHQINSLIQRTKEKYQSYKIENKKDYIFKTLEEIKTLYIKKSYDKAMELAERVLNIDDKNEAAKTYLEKALKKANKESDRQILKDIVANYKKYKNLPDRKLLLIKI